MLMKIGSKYSTTLFFLLAFGISWTGALILVAPKITGGIPISKMDGLLMFPIMLTGPVVGGIFMTFVVDGNNGLKNLWNKIRVGKLSLKWYLVATLIPPCLITLLLVVLQFILSPSFKPNFFLIGFLFGIPAGLLEEIGWTGYAMQALLKTKSVVQTGIILGLLWGVWHLPVIDFLGAATPHGRYLISFFISFITLLTAMRVLMTWVYKQTKSILIIQLMHIVSTGSLVVFGPFGVSPLQETQWYALYALLLSLLVAIILYTTKHSYEN